VATVEAAGYFYKPIVGIIATYSASGSFKIATMRVNAQPACAPPYNVYYGLGDYKGQECLIFTAVEIRHSCPYCVLVALAFANVRSIELG
jgi:hypothetical protein